MKVLGITAEYNPLHNGHIYHLEEARRISGADCVVIAMSGDFTQRGETAIADKWARGRCAVECGADIVVEIPFIYSCNRAEHYARGAVDTLAAMGVDAIAFGCEADAPDELIELADAMSKMGSKFKALIDIHMKNGLSAAKARELSVRTYIGDEAAGLMSSPNNILALEYIRRINELNAAGASIEIVPVVRKGSGYFEDNSEQGFSGATQIRKGLKENGAPDGRAAILAADRVMPEESVNMLLKENEKAPIGNMLQEREDKIYQLLRFEILRTPAEKLAAIYGIGEGIENRMKKVAVTAGSLQEFISEMVSKRYTAATINRMITYILTGLPKGHGPEDTEVEYIRLLAAGKQGRAYLKEGRKSERIKLPVVTNMNKDGGFEGLKTDSKAADIYNIITGKDIYDCSDHVVMPFID